MLDKAGIQIAGREPKSVSYEPILAERNARGNTNGRLTYCQPNPGAHYSAGT